MSPVKSRKFQIFLKKRRPNVAWAKCRRPNVAPPRDHSRRPQPIGLFERVKVEFQGLSAHIPSGRHFAWHHFAWRCFAWLGIFTLKTTQQHLSVKITGSKYSDENAIGSLNLYTECKIVIINLISGLLVKPPDWSLKAPGSYLGHGNNKSP